MSILFRSLVMSASPVRGTLPAALAFGFALLVSPTAARAQGAAPPPATAPAAGATGFGPNGATLRCRDGSYPAAGAPDSACEGKGGVLVRFPTRPARPAAAAAAPVPAGTEVRESPREAVPAPGFVSFAEIQRRVEEDKARRGRPPEGATLLCEDGSYVMRDTASVRCQAKGGVRARFELPPRPDRD
jgi:hypothetical protein